MKILKYIFILTLINTSLFSEPVINIYQYKIKDRVISKYKIYLKDDLLYCTGNDPAGSNNNIAADLIADAKYIEARDKLKYNIKMAPLFLPYHYNISISYIFIHELDRAVFHLKRCNLIFPDYYPVYIQLGYVYDRKNRLSLSLDNYRKALKLHPRNPEVYVLMGDIYFRRKQFGTALKYYRGSLKIDPNYSNGLLGEAKILFQNERYFFAINKLRTIKKSPNIDITYHFYYAEASYKTGDYKTALREYNELLKYKNSRFFLTNSYLLIQHKRDLAQRFADR